MAEYTISLWLDVTKSTKKLFAWELYLCQQESLKTNTHYPYDVSHDIPMAPKYLSNLFHFVLPIRYNITR